MIIFHSRYISLIRRKGRRKERKGEKEKKEEDMLKYTLKHVVDWGNALRDGKAVS